MSAKEQSRKIHEREAQAPKPPAKKKPERVEEEGPAGVRRKISPPGKGKRSRAAALFAAGAIALGTMISPPKAEARTMPREPTREPQIVDVGTYDLKIHGGYSPFTEGESVSSLLSSMEEETEKYRIPGSKDSFRIPISGGRSLLLQHNPSDKDVLCGVTPSINDVLANTGARIISFNLDYRYLDIEEPEIRIKLTEKSIVLSLLDPDTGRHARINIPRASPGPEELNLALFDENAVVDLAEQAFFALNSLPTSHNSGNAASKVLDSALESAEFLLALRSKNIQFSRASGWEADPFEETIDTFIELYSSFGGDALEKLAELMEGMDRKQKSEIAKLAIPRITALILRPYAAWKGMGVLNKLDSLISSPEFSQESLQVFAWENGLAVQLGDLLKNVREDFSK